MLPNPHSLRNIPTTQGKISKLSKANQYCFKASLQRR
jgi:hypothetical protein